MAAIGRSGYLWCVVLLALQPRSQAIDPREYTGIGLQPWLQEQAREEQEAQAVAITAAANQFKSQVQALRLATAAEGKPTCMGLVDKTCKPCPNGGEKKFCDGVKEECRTTFCRPFCEELTWKCKVKFTGKEFAKEAANKQYGESLCSQFIAQGCAKIMKCCALDNEMWDYIENYAYFDQYPDPRFPSPACTEGPTPKLCNKCKAAVKVKLELGNCPFPAVNGAKAKPKTFRRLLAVDEQPASATSFLEHMSRRIDSTVSAVAPQTFADDDDSDAAWAAVGGLPRMEWNEWEGLQAMLQISGMDSNTQLTKAGGFPGKPAHKSLYERCAKMLKKVKSKLSSMKSKFQQKACACMGCCEGGCFFEVQEQFKPGGKRL